MIRFPQNFFWGAATSAHQVEGNNTNSDWWEWEQRTKIKEPSGFACRHYELYKEDFNLVSNLGHNAHRLSLEWSRIEPEKGNFSQEALEHYKEVILSLKERNIEPVVTLHHFTNPIWFAKSGGWLNKDSLQYFCRYVEKTVSFLCDKINYWVTINEPMVYVYHAYILGVWPPQEKSFLKARVVKNNFINSHINSYRLIRDIYKSKDLPAPFISIAKNLQAFEPIENSLKNKFAVYLHNKVFNFDFLEKLKKAHALDFIGVNYYTRNVVGKIPFNKQVNNANVFKKNSLGWDIYPVGLYKLLLQLKKFNSPVFILENGICTNDDTQRWEFIREHLKSMHMAMQAGVDVIGYIYWSLIDNFEWDKGFSHRFGLIEVDYNTYKRIIRESANKFSQVCKARELDY